MGGLVEMGYIGLNKNKRNGENNEFKDKITFEFALDTLPNTPIRLEDGFKVLLETNNFDSLLSEKEVRTRALFSDSGTFELLGTVNVPSGQKLALGSPSRSDIKIVGGGTISGEGTITGGGFG